MLSNCACLSFPDRTMGLSIARHGGISEISSSVLTGRCQWLVPGTARAKGLPPCRAACASPSGSQTPERAWLVCNPSETTSARKLGGETRPPLPRRAWWEVTRWTCLHRHLRFPDSSQERRLFPSYRRGPRREGWQAPGDDAGGQQGATAGPVAFT